MKDFKDWQVPIVKQLMSGEYTENSPLRVTEALYHTQSLGHDIGRSSVQVFLKGLAQEGLVGTREEPGRGGYHGVFWAIQGLKGSTNNES